MRLAGLLLLTAGAAWIALTIFLLGYGFRDLYENAGGHWAIAAAALLTAWIVLGARRDDR